MYKTTSHALTSLFGSARTASALALLLVVVWSASAQQSSAQPIRLQKNAVGTGGTCLNTVGYQDVCEICARETNSYNIFEKCCDGGRVFSLCETIVSYGGRKR